MIQNAVKEEMSKNLEERWTKARWEEILDVVEVGCRLTPEERLSLEGNGACELLAAAPFLADQAYPDYIAGYNVGAFVLAMRQGLFFGHRPGQSLRDRIEPGLRGAGGDSEVLDAVLTVLESVSLNDHHNDRLEDRESGHPNPLNMGFLHFPTERDRLDRALGSIPSWILDPIRSIVSETRGFWNV